MISDAITFIIHLRKDTEERKKNADIVIPYYISIAPNSKFIIVEDDIAGNFQYLNNQKNILYINSNNKGSYNKCKSYNIGLKHATTDLVCFLDIDCIVSEANLSKSIETALHTNGIAIGYNGVAIYLNYKAKEQIAQLDAINIYDHLNSLVDKKNIYNEFKTEHYHIGNVKAVGGVLIGRCEIFNLIKGFNPNFIGWGYEDNEIITRAHKLGVSIFYTNTNKPYLFHLPHIQQEKESVKNHISYKSNEEEYLKILSLNRDQLNRYINAW